MLRRLKRIIWLLPLLTGIAAVSAQSELPRLEPGDCQFDPGYGAGYGMMMGADSGITCGYLVVPEDRSQPEGSRVRLHYAVFHATGDNPQPDAVVYLEGGPGGHTLSFLPWSYDVLGYPFGEQRDVVFFDQRGAGYSRPALDCPEYDAIRYQMLGESLSEDDQRQQILNALTSCRTRLQSRGVNVAAYNSAENAADLEDLRRLLGYPQWNLYGISYGTRLALTAMRDHPHGIRSVILDSVLPLEVSLYDDEPANLDRALNLLFLACTRDAECSARYPRLGTVFYELVDQLNAEPGVARINHPTTRAELTVLVDGDQLIGLAFGALYSPEWFRLLPKIIYDVRAGNYRLLASTLEAILEDQGGFSLGMHLAVQCNEETPFASREGVAASMQMFPALADFFNGEPNTGLMILSACEAWTTRPPAAHENAPVNSPIPTLVQSGEFDPITPPHWGRMVAASLPNSYAYEYPGMGHGASVGSACAMQMAVAFIEDPSRPPDDSCIAAMPAPEFLVVEDSLNLIPFSDADLGLRSVRPESWIDLGLSDFARSEIDDTLLRFYRFDGVLSDYIVREIAADFDEYGRPTATDRRRANGMTWELYEFRRGDQHLDVAIAVDGSDAFAVLLVSGEYERDLLYLEVLLPAVDALEAL